MSASSRVSLRLGRWGLRLCLALALLCAHAVTATPSTEASWASVGYSVLRYFDRADVIHHQITAEIDPQAGEARFLDDVTFSFDRPATSFHVLLGVDAVLDRVVDPETGHTLDARPTLSWSSLPFTVYRVSLSGTGARDATTRTVRYEWHLPRDQVKGINPFISSRHFYLGYPSLWYPHTPAEDFFDAEITVKAPPGYRAFADGALVRESLETGEFTYRTESPTDKLGVGVGRFAVDEVEWPRQVEAVADDPEAPRPEGDAPVNVGTIEVWQPIGFASTAAEVAYHVRESLTFFEERLGSLPLSTLRVVEVPFFVPASFPSLSTLTYGGNLQYLGLSGAGAPAILAVHETAHKWLGGVAGVPPVGSAWFAEGLAEYLGHLALASYMPEEWAHRTFASRVYEPFVASHGRGAPRRPRSLASIEVFDEDSPLLFQKGALLFRMLHRRLGDDVFFDAVRRFVNERREGHGTARDFEAILRSMHDTNEALALEQFFTSWVRGTRSLDYALQVSRTNEAPDDSGRFEMEMTLLSRGELVEPGTVEVEFRFLNSQSQWERLEAGESRTFTLPEKPLSVRLDPHHWLADSDPSNNIWTP